MAQCQSPSAIGLIAESMDFCVSVVTTQNVLHEAIDGVTEGSPCDILAEECCH